MHPSEPISVENTRRDFLHCSAALAAGTTILPLTISRAAHASGSDMIKIGLIGCGGRGTGAAVNAMNSGTDVRLVAIGDLFADQAQRALKQLKARKPDQVLVDEDHVFDGFDAFQKVIDSDVDAVLIAATSRFHPRFLQAAIEAGKHVFIEKPHAVDVPGLQVVQAACEEAKKKNLCIVSGLCWRYDSAVRETVQRVLDGAIGDVVAIEETYLRTTYHMTQRDPEWTELQWQLRNWYHFNWLSGDDICQSLIHNLDKSAWVLHEEPPIAAFGTGGRSSVVESVHGDQFDHFAVAYEYANGVRVYGFDRAQDGIFNQTADCILGTRGEAHMPSQCKIVVAGKTVWQPDRQAPRINMYDMEHKELFDSIRSGNPIHDGLRMVRSTMLAILGRMACYTGKKISWEDAWKSTDLLGPDPMAWDTEPPVQPRPDGLYPVPVPGFGKI